MAHLFDIAHGIVLVVLGVIAQGFIRIGKIGNRELFFYRRGRLACFGWGCIGGVAFPTRLPQSVDTANRIDSD